MSDDTDRDEEGYPQGVHVNYGIRSVPNGNGNGTAIIKWIAATSGTCFVAVVAYLFIDNASIRREGIEDRKVLTEQLASIRERLTAIETKQQTGCKQ